MTTETDIELSDTDILLLQKLNRSGAVAIGIRKSYANTLWSKVTLSGKIANSLTLPMAVLCVIMFAKVGTKAGFTAMVTLAIYVLLVQKIAVWVVRDRLLYEGNGYFFKDAYDDRNATLRNSMTGETISTPTDWRDWINKQASTVQSTTR